VTDFVTTSQLETAYEVSGPGDGAAVVAVHGWPDDPHTWDGLLDLLHDGGCRVYRPYLRGFGPTRFRDAATRRSGQIAALCRDVGEFIEVLALQDVILAGHDSGARAGYALAATSPGSVAGLVAMSVAYGTTGPTARLAPDQAHAYWYQWYFSTQLGRRGLAGDRRGVCRYLWRAWSPSWNFTDGEFDQAAAAWENPDWVEITVHSYSQRCGAADGDPGLAELEARPPSIRNASSRPDTTAARCRESGISCRARHPGTRPTRSSNSHITALPEASRPGLRYGPTR
jgi:pimeloyl-ACP methyl ester carboxylesterase